MGKAVLVAAVGRQSALKAEMSYSRRTLAAGVARGLREAIVSRDVDGLKRAGAIVAGLSMTAVGFLEGRARTRVEDRFPVARAFALDAGGVETYRSRSGSSGLRGESVHMCGTADIEVPSFWCLSACQLGGLSLGSVPSPVVQRVLVTGGAGYIGSITAHHLCGRGHEVVVLDSLVHGFAEALPVQAVLVQGDVGDRGALDQALPGCARSSTAPGSSSPPRASSPRSSTSATTSPRLLPS